MLAQLRKLRTDEGGFTLIELLMVIVILGILSGIVVFAVGGITDRGTSAACKSDIKTTSVAVEAYYAQNSRYPAALSDLVPGFLHSAPTDVALGAGGAVTGIDGTGATPKSQNCSGVTA
jgi:prepilin-type N-terminal cleavage/methylation domain-containing protein